MGPLGLDVCTFCGRERGCSISRKQDGPKGPTCGDGLPAQEEERPGLDGVADDGAVVLQPRGPGHGGSGLRHLGHLAVHWRARRTCEG